MLEHLFNSPFLHSLSLTLLHFLWQGVLVALALKSALLVCHHNRPQLRYALSTLAMIANLILPIITFTLIYSSELALAGSGTTAFTLTSLIQELNQPKTLLNYQALTELLPAFLPYLALLWLTTVTLLASKLLVQIYNVNQLPRQGSIDPDEKLLTRFNELAKQINLTITPQLLISLKVEVPMAIGWLKPVVLIPVTMVTGLNSAQLEMLILHELAHIRRHDYLVNFLQTFVEILLFFHPAVLWVSKQMRNEREYCSDDIAVQHCGNAIAYAHTLADTASLCTQGKHSHTIPSMAMAATGGDLKQRVMRLVDHHCAPQNNVSKWFASAIIIMSVLFLSTKPLLTLTSLEFWHNDIPFQNSINNINQTTQNNLLLANNAVALSSNIFNIELPSNSLAKQLLTPASLNTERKSLTFTKTNNEAKSQTSNQIKTAAQYNKNRVTAANTNYKDVSLIEQDLALSTHAKRLAQPSLKATSQLNVNIERTHKPELSSNPTPAITPKLAKQKSMAPSTASANKRITVEVKAQESKTDLIAAKTKNSGATQNLNTANLASKKKIQDLTEATEQTLESLPIWRNAKKLKSVNPIYPSIAKRKGIEIDVQVDFTIDVDGNIKNIQFARQNKINYFKNSIRSAIKQWRFVPAKVDDKPVESHMTKVFSFNLQS